MFDHLGESTQVSLPFHCSPEQSLKQLQSVVGNWSKKQELEEMASSLSPLAEEWKGEIFASSPFPL